MVGVPFLVSRCEAGPSARIGWPLPCFEPQRRDDHRPEEEHEQQPGRRRAERAERQIAEQIEDARRRAKDRPARSASRFPNVAFRRTRIVRASAATSGPMRLPFEPLIMTTSPPRSASASSRRMSFDRSAQRGAHRRRRGVVERARQRAGAEQQVDPVGASSGASAACIAAPSGPSSSMSPITAMRRPPRPGSAAPSSASAARIEAGLAL